MISEKMGRRKFIKNAASAVLGVMAGGLRGEDQALAKTESVPAVEYRLLGKTGLKVTAVGMGVMNCSDPSVLLRAYDLGINFYDTADCYMRGKNEEMVGKAFQGKRDRVLIQTKVHDHDESKMRASVERSLRRLRTDYVDVLVWHNQSSPKEVSDPRLHEFMEKMKKEGKAHFTGFSAHSRMADLLKEAARSSLHDVALVSYNFTHSKKMKEAVALAAKAGIGIIAMKTQAGGYKKEKMKGLSPHQAALRYVLTDRNVSTAIPGVTSIEQIEESAGVMGTSLSKGNLDQLERYQAFLGGRICTMCGECDGTCPHGIPHGDLLRAAMYYDGYENKELARESLGNGDVLQGIRHCSECSSCSVHCRRGLDIRAQIQWAVQIVSG